MILQFIVEIFLATLLCTMLGERRAATYTHCSCCRFFASDPFLRSIHVWKKVLPTREASMPLVRGWRNTGSALFCSSEVISSAPQGVFFMFVSRVVHACVNDFYSTPTHTFAGGGGLVLAGAKQVLSTAFLSDFWTMQNCSCSWRCLLIA